MHANKVLNFELLHVYMLWLNAPSFVLLNIQNYL